MPHRKRRFSVTRKVALGLALIIMVGMACMLIIYRGLERVGVALERVAAVQAPIVAAAYGMEVNVNGAMLHVLNYLASRRPEHRVEAEDDVGDFDRYHATYLRLVASESERALAERIRGHHAQFTRLANELMKLADRQESLYAAIDELTAEFDYLLDARLQPGLFRESELRRDGIGAAVASADLEAEMAEVAQQVANYHRQPTPALKRTIAEKMRVVERVLGHFLSFNLGAQERQQEPLLRGFVSRIGQKVGEVVTLEDEILDGRNRLIALRESMDDLLDDEIQILAVGGLDAPKAQAKAAADEVLVAMQLLVPMFLFAAGIIGFLLIQVIRTPLGKLYHGTLAVTGGDLSYRISPASNDEFGDLARQYNAMVEQLQATTVSVTELRHEIAERERAERERENLQAELRRSETMSAMGALVAGVAHEVRNPLFAISSTLDALTARMGEPSEFARFIENLQAQVSRLGKLMADLLAYGRPPANELSHGPVDPVVASAVESCSDLARESGVTIAARLATDLPEIRLDQNRMTQALSNLVDNALRHAPRGSVVSVETRVVDCAGRDYIECSVSDQGPGFQESDLPHVFEPFFTRRHGGTGLGLALVQRIVTEHGGEVSARNGTAGGAVVTMRLPAAEARA